MTSRRDTKNDQPLGRQVRKGLVWSFMNNAVARGASTMTGIVLAHLLVPKDFGVFAVALVMYNGLLSMNELGVSLAIVRWPGDVDEIGPTVTTLAIASSVILYALLFVSAPWCARLLGVPGSTGVLRVLCFGVVIDGITSTPAALLQRIFRQDLRTVADQANVVVGAAASIFLALHGWGAWSLAWGRIAGNAVSAALILVLSPGRYRPAIKRSEVRPLLAFGLPLACSSLLVFAVLNVDYIVVGAVLGPVSLGFYLLAFNLSSWPVNMFSTTIRSVSLAGFSRLQDDQAALRTSFVRSLGWTMAITVPVCALLVALAGPAVRLVYGAKWGPASSALRLLAVLGGCRVALELAYDYLVALGRSRTCLLLQAWWLLALIPVLTVGAHIAGIGGVAAGHTIIVLVVVTPAFLMVFLKTGVSLRALGAHVGRPIAGGIAAAAAAGLAAQFVGGSFLQLLCGSCAGLVVYVPFVYPELRQLAGARRGPVPPTVEMGAGPGLPHSSLTATASVGA